MLIDGRYEIEAELGVGGMGIVYLARDVGLDRRVAVKVIAPAWVKDSGIATRFQQEARALASVRSPTWCRSTRSAGKARATSS